MKTALNIFVILVLFTSAYCLHQATEDTKQLASDNAKLQDQIVISEETQAVLEDELRVALVSPVDLRPLGTFTVSYYCTEDYPHICNDGDLTTKTGGLVKANHSVAVDPTIIPLGSFIFVNGHVYYADDTGGSVKGKHIDIAVPTHKEALDLGVQEVTVFIFKED